MKITRRTVKASEELAVAPEAEVAVAAVVECPYQCAIEKIMEAIECLGAVAKDDTLARESIANLSVVLFDLKG